MSDPADTNLYLSDPDARLMLDFQKGNKKSFEQLLTKYYPPILNFIYRFLGDRQAAEDLAQEVFIKIYNSQSSYKLQSKFQTWAYTIAKNLSLNELRKRKRVMISLDETVEIEGGDIKIQVEDKTALKPGVHLMNEEMTEAVRDAVNALPENQRMAVILRRYDGFSYEEIANTMNTSVKAVKSLLNRAKENLKIALFKWVKE